MPKCNSNDEVMAAIIDCLGGELAQLALNVKRLVTTADMQRHAQLKAVEQAELRTMSAATERDAQAIDVAEAANFPLSPVEAPLAEPKAASHREENAIAARVAELYDRLGGFINPSLPQPNQNT